MLKKYFKIVKQLNEARGVSEMMTEISLQLLKELAEETTSQVLKGKIAKILHENRIRRSA